MVGLDGVHRVTVKLADGSQATYYYARRGKGAPRLDPDDLAGSYARALERATDNSFSGAIDDFQKSHEHAKRNERWRKELESYHEIIRATFGTAKPSFFCRPEMRARVKRFRDKVAGESTNKKADNVVGELIFICGWLVDEGRIKDHAIGKIKKLHKPQDRSEIIIEPHERDAWAASAKDHVAPLIVLAGECGLDMADLARLQWSFINLETGVIAARRGKTNIKARPVLTPTARKILGTLSRDGLYVFHNSSRKPWKIEGLRTAIQRAKQQAIKSVPSLAGKTFKDFRGTACTSYHALGYSHSDIGLFMGWSEKQVESRLRNYLARDTAAAAAVVRLDERTKKRI